MNPDVLWRYAPSLISGFGVTILCWGAGGALGLLIGFAITLMNRLGIPPLRWALRVFIEVFRGTPFLMQLFLIYAGGPSIGLRLGATTAGIVGLGLYSSASPPCRLGRSRRRQASAWRRSTRCCG